MRQMRARLLRLFFPFREGFVTPSPPRVLTLDVEQELSYCPAVRRQQTHHLADAAICSLPLLRFLVEVFQPPEFIIEQRADPGEPGRRPDLGTEPREIRVRYHEFGKEFVTADQSPYGVGIAHGTILPSALSAAIEDVDLKHGDV
jgi:hypothetical protein